MTKGEVLKAIRAYCLGCSCGHESEVAKCVMTKCELYQFRFGKDPHPNEAKAEAMRRRMATQRAENEKTTG